MPNSTEVFCEGALRRGQRLGRRPRLHALMFNAACPAAAQAETTPAARSNGSGSLGVAAARDAFQGLVAMQQLRGL